MESNNTLIISYDPLNGKEALLAAIAEYNATIIYDYKYINSLAIRIPDETKIQDAIEFFSAVHGVLSVIRDSIIHIDD